MSTSLLPTIEVIQDTFVREITQLGGSATEAVRCDELLIVRSRLPHTEEVRAGDEIEGGVALRATGLEVFVHPYTMRKVCQNGAVMAVLTDTRRLLRVEPDSPPERADELLEDLRVAVQACAHRATLRDAVGAMRQAREVPVIQHHLTELLLSLASIHMFDADLLRSIMQRFVRDRDRTLFGVMNAVTSLARDTRDPQLRWHLEEMGGAVPALVHPRQKPGGACAQPHIFFVESLDDVTWPAELPEDDDDPAPVVDHLPPSVGRRLISTRH